jgi:hypothetical protein
LITEKRWLYSSFTFLEQLPMGGEQLPIASKYQRVGSCLLLLRANPYFRALSRNQDPSEWVLESRKNAIQEKCDSFQTKDI